MEEFIKGKQDKAIQNPGRKQVARENNIELREKHGPFGSAHEEISRNPECEKGESTVDVEEDITRRYGWNINLHIHWTILSPHLTPEYKLHLTKRNLVAYSVSYQPLSLRISKRIYRMLIG